jgi:hypothetical protein
MTAFIVSTRSRVPQFPFPWRQPSPRHVLVNVKKSEPPASTATAYAGWFLPYSAFRFLSRILQASLPLSLIEFRGFQSRRVATACLYFIAAFDEVRDGDVTFHRL